MKRSIEKKFLDTIQFQLKELYIKELGDTIRKGKLDAKRRRYAGTN